MIATVTEHTCTADNGLTAAQHTDSCPRCQELIVERYDAAVAAATTSQGLDPLAYLLTVAGVDHVIEQTGGFCMVLTVTTDDGTYAVIQDGEGPSDWMVGFHAGDSWHDADADPDDADYAFGLTLDETVARLKAATGR